MRLFDHTTNIVSAISRILATTALLCGCSNSASDDDDPEPPGPAAPPGEGNVLRGTIQIAEAPPDPEEIRVALVWAMHTGIEDNRHLGAQDVAVSATWPASFELVLPAAPPTQAILEPKDLPSARQATARVIAYRDLNHNGELDFTPIDADHFVDELVAYNTESWLFYNDSGYTLFIEGNRVEPTAPITLLASPAKLSSCHLLEWRPRFSYNTGLFAPPIPEQSPFGPIDPTLECPDDVAPSQTERLACDPISPIPDVAYFASWSATTSAFVAKTCGPVMRTCEKRRDLSKAKPLGWPCPCDPKLYECVQDPGDL